MPSHVRAAMTSRVAGEIRIAIATTTRATSETRKPRAPAPLPSRRPAELTTSLTTRQAKTAPRRQKKAPANELTFAVPASRKPTTSAITPARIVIRPRAEPCVPVVPASIPIAMPMPSSRQIPEKDPMPENLAPRAGRRRFATLSPMSEPPHRRRAHASSSDLERYAGLFAQRTRVMRSSAMRDLMAVTARPEVISLAGGLPDTSTFPPQTFAAQMTRIAQESAAEALQYGPTEGFEETRSAVRMVMEAEGMSPDPDDIIVTTGGQQALDLIAKTLVDPGDVVICEAPTYPGAVPVFCSYEADTHQVAVDDDGMRIDELEALCERLDAE